jgi:phage terminase large subunit
MAIRVDVPRKLKPLLYPKRYKGAKGGRGGAKSHFFAEQIVLRCYQRTTRVVCIREIQNSIKDSVKQLILDKIAKLGLGDFFSEVENEIRGPDGSLIIFKGMQSYNADNIKSLEGYDIAWVEEAQTLSAHSLRMLRPTIRKTGSELWFSWNPRHKTDPVDAMFRDNEADPDFMCIVINWRDNPWFPDELRKEMERDFRNDPDGAEHVWNGAYGSSQGAILAKWVNKADREGRIHDDVVFDPAGLPIEVSSDIGFRDTASWWYWQRCLGGFRLLKYEGDSGLDADDWIPQIKDTLKELGGPKLGKIWLPHDARAKTFQSKHTTIERFLEHFKGQVDIVAQSKKLDQISAARDVIERCEFHKTLCDKGIDGLLAWEYEWNEELNVFSREPVHDWASHPSDAFSYGCQVMQEAPPPAESANKPRFLHETTAEEVFWPSKTSKIRDRI